MEAFLPMRSSEQDNVIGLGSAHFHLCAHATFQNFVFFRTFSVYQWSVLLIRGGVNLWSLYSATTLKTTLDFLAATLQL